jgi:hypothetical protein
MEKNRILELAIEALERKKAKIDAEIESLRSEIKGQATTPGKKITSAKPAIKPGKSAAERKAQSERMKKIWAKRKSKAGKGKGKEKAKASAAKPAKTKVASTIRPKTAAEKKALSLKMKEVWKKKKAEAAQKAKAATEGTKTTQ